jgi:ethanolamine ammonia-lyase small subunit
MAGEKDHALAAASWPEIVQRIRARTPARLLVGRAGSAYPTATQLELREAHAAARDAVWAELDTRAIFTEKLLDQWKLFEVSTRAANKQEYLLRPDLGRHLADSARLEILGRCSKGNDIQIAIGDGLSAAAVAAQVPRLIPLLYQSAIERGWTVGQTLIVRYCRVAILNEIGELLTPRVVVLLIGERPGLAAADSLSAYMAYRPDSAHTDANRNLVSNIHSRGLSPEDAADRILRLAELMTLAGTSGFHLRIGDPNLTRTIIGAATTQGQKEKTSSRDVSEAKKR